jgi:hypothetical protein
MPRVRYCVGILERNGTPSMNAGNGKNLMTLGLLTILLILAETYCLRAQSMTNSSAIAAEDPTAHALYIKARVEDTKAFRALRPGQTVETTLSEAVYSGNAELFPAASQMVLTVRSIDKCRKVPSNRWPWTVKVFLPRHENCPAFDAGRVLLGDGRKIPLQLTLISTGREREVRVGVGTRKTVKSTAFDGSQARGVDASKIRAAGLTLTFEATEQLSDADEGSAVSLTPKNAESAELPSLPALEAGTEAKVILLSVLSASKSHRGDSFRARLVEPVLMGNGYSLPEGTILEGDVTKAVRPRWLSRSGALLLSFKRIVPSEEAAASVSASMVGAELNQGSQATIDGEGTLHGARPGKLWTLINLATTAGISKEIDDTTQLVFEALISTATDASTAGTARLVSAGVSGLFMITRRGSDVVLPKFTEMRIVFNRSVSAPMLPTRVLTSDGE